MVIPMPSPKAMEWQNVQLSQHFSLWEMVKSDKHPDLVNLPAPLVVYWLRWFARAALQPLRDVAGPLVITSGYRPFALNRIVKGEPKSIHQIFVDGEFQGVAADLYAIDMPCDELVRLIAAMLAANPRLPIRGIIVYPHENRLHIDSRKGDRPRFFKCVPPIRPDGKKYYPEIAPEAAVNFRLK